MMPLPCRGFLDALPISDDDNSTNMVLLGPINMTWECPKGNDETGSFFSFPNRGSRLLIWRGSRSRAPPVRDQAGWVLTRLALLLEGIQIESDNSGYMRANLVLYILAGRNRKGP